MALQGYAIGPREGEHLILRGGDIFIKEDPSTGSKGLTMGTQQIPVGVGIPIHRHFEMDEAFCVIAGRGILILNDVPHFIETGGTIFIPKNTWHGFENADSELVLLWIVAPPGLEAFFRKVAAPPGEPQYNEQRISLTKLPADKGRNLDKRARAGDGCGTAPPHSAPTSTEGETP